MSNAQIRELNSILISKHFPDDHVRRSEVADLIPEMVTIREAAARTGLSYDFLRKACLRGSIVCIRCGSKFLINFGRLVEWLNSARGGAEA